MPKLYIFLLVVLDFLLLIFLNILKILMSHHIFFFWVKIGAKALKFKKKCKLISAQWRNDDPYNIIESEKLR